jgi:hypothetical protein
MKAGAEKEHTLEVLQQADHRGADACLETQQLFGPIRQKVPYPAFRWDWKTKDAWRWKHEQHINMLEAQAFLHHLRTRSADPRRHNERFVHVLDSQVAVGVLAKGRSSSHRLNRICKRVAGLALATNQYPLYLWTISKWNYADLGSRIFDT